MRPLWMLQNDAADYVLAHSRLARWTPTVAYLLARDAVSILRMAKGEHHTRQELQRQLTAELSPGVWLVLRWLVPIVVRLVLDWWFRELEHRNE